MVITRLKMCMISFPQSFDTVAKASCLSVKAAIHDQFGKLNYIQPVPGHIARLCANASFTFGLS